MRQRHLLQLATVTFFMSQSGSESHQLYPCLSLVISVSLRKTSGCSSHKGNALQFKFPKMRLR